jgi:hypothetical protein
VYWPRVSESLGILRLSQIRGIRTQASLFLKTEGGGKPWVLPSILEAEKRVLAKGESLAFLR